MKIVFTAQGKNPDSLLDPRFGRAEGFLIYTTSDRLWEFRDNIQNINAPQGAGIQAGRQIIDCQADVLVTGSVGPKAFQVLHAGQIKICICEKNLTVLQALELFEQGRLREARDATGPGLG